MQMKILTVSRNFADMLNMLYLKKIKNEWSSILGGKIECIQK